MRTNFTDWNLASGLVAVLLLLASCSGGTTTPAPPSDNMGTLAYTVATDAGSSVAAPEVSGKLVTVEAALTARDTSSLPPGNEALFAVLFRPETAPGEGFSGSIRLRYTKPDGTVPMHAGLADIYYIAPITLEPIRLDSAYQQADGWFTFHVTALGYFVIALENGFKVQAFADMAAAAGGEPINFRARSTNGVQPITYHWVFGDGQTGSGVLVAHAYAAPGSYTVSLTAQDATGAQSFAASTPIEITGFAAPVSAVTVAVTRDPLNGMSFDYFATITGGTPPFAYAWEFDLGQADAQDTSAPSHTFTTPGIHQGRLTVTDSLGATASTAFESDAVPPSITGLSVAAEQDAVDPLLFNYNATVIGGTAPFAYEWEFAPGVAGDENSPTVAHTFSAPGTYSGTLTVTDSFGIIATQQFVSDAQVPQITALTVDVVQDAVNKLAFTYNATVTGGSAPFSYAWEFAPGVGGAEDSASVAHTFSALGVYNGTLTVTDKYGLIATQNFVSDTQVPPFTGLTVDVVQDSVDPLTFSYTATVSGGSAPFSYAWEFAPGVLGTEDSPTVTHKFDDLGTYNGLLTVTDTYGLVATHQFVSDAQAPPITDVTVEVFQDDEDGLAFTYNAIVTGGAVPFTYEWEFENGVIDGQNTPTPNYTFPKRGLYNGSLTVTDRFGSSAKTQFQSDARPPIITDVIPPRVKIGDQIQIIGEYFLGQQDDGAVELEGLSLPVVTWSDKLIVATIPPGAVSGKLTVQQRGRSNEFDLTVFP